MLKSIKNAVVMGTLAAIVVVVGSLITVGTVPTVGGTVVVGFVVAWQLAR